VSYRGARIGVGLDAGTARKGERLGITSILEDRRMEQIVLSHDEEVDHSAKEARVVRAWRVEQLRRLGLTYVLAYTFADLVDWHALAALVERGCSPELALEIVR
jgi:hypothetical protein